MHFNIGNYGCRLHFSIAYDVTWQQIWGKQHFATYVLCI